LLEADSLFNGFLGNARTRADIKREVVAKGDIVITIQDEGIVGDGSFFRKKKGEGENNEQENISEVHVALHDTVFPGRAFYFKTELLEDVTDC